MEKKYKIAVAGTGCSRLQNSHRRISYEKHNETTNPLSIYEDGNFQELLHR